MKKFITSLALILLGASTLLLPSLASSPDNSSDSNPDLVSYLCEYCGHDGMVFADEYYTPWYTVDFVSCQGHDPRYNDFVENRTHVEIYQCPSCKLGTSVVSTEEQISHKHPAMRAYDLPRF